MKRLSLTEYKGNPNEVTTPNKVTTNKGTPPVLDYGSLVQGSLGSLVSFPRSDPPTQKTRILDEGGGDKLEAHWGADEDGFFPCPLPGHPGRARVHHEEGKWWLGCCSGRHRSPAEVRAAQAYGADALRSNKELAIWWRRLGYELGCFEPADVDVPALPDDASPTLHHVRNGFVLLLGLRRADYPPCPVTFSVRFAAAWCEVGHHEAANSLKELRQRDVIRLVEKQGKLWLYEPGGKS